MATLVPKVSINEITVKPERDTARSLVEQLPDNCVIYHSQPWLRSDRNDKGIKTLREGETDFVIVLPGYGLLVLEVKGGDMTYDQDTQQWGRLLSSGDIKPVQNPFEQVRRNSHFLIDKIKSDGYLGASTLPFTYGYAIAFPDCDYNGPVPPGSDPAIIFGYKDLKFMDKRVIAALKQWQQGTKPSQLELDDINKIQRAISPSFSMLPVLCRKIEEQEEKIFTLTENQLSLLEFLGSQNRACIEGVAGSGKTILAQARAERFAAEGKTTLVVCYNKVLAEWIESTIPAEFSKLITVKHFHGLCADWVRRSGQKFNPNAAGQTGDFWREKAPELLLDAIDILPERFDAVIVDEGQDFQPNWWMPLEMINAHGDEGSMYVFYDPRQNLYVDQRGSIPALGEPFKLPTNCRNTRAIAKKCGDILGVDIPTLASAPEGKVPDVLDLLSSTQVRNRVSNLLDEWISKGKLRCSQVAILSPTKKEYGSIAGVFRLNNIELVTNIENWKEGKGVLFSTVKSFKGLEADAIVLIDVPEEFDDKYFTETDYYVACSRAKHMITIIRIARR